MVGEEIVGEDELSVVVVVAFEELDFTSPLSIKVVEFLRELFWLFGSDDDDEDVGVPGTSDDDAVFIIMVSVAELLGAILDDAVASNDVLDNELSEVDEVLAYDELVVFVVDDDGIEVPLPVVSMNFDA